ncbi:MAG: hypothetical protein ACXVHJ_37545, partial [Solirubrobacteraceae bacterium]
MAHFHITGSQGGGEEATGRKAGTGASPPTLPVARFVWTVAETRFPPVAGGVTPLSTRPQPIP